MLVSVAFVRLKDAATTYSTLAILWILTYTFVLFQRYVPAYLNKIRTQCFPFVPKIYAKHSLLLLRIY